MAYFLRKERPATRHEACDRYFHVGYPPKALDGGSPIPWQSLGARIAAMVCHAPNCDHSTCKMYLVVTHHSEDPVTHDPGVEFLAPITTNWANRRMF